MTTTVLLADDHPLIFAGVTALLRNSSYEVVATAQNGDEVLNNLGSTRPDILILDMEMPGKSGLEVLRILRSKGDPRPVILLTAGLADAALLEAVELKVNGIVLKESAPAQLVQCLDSVRSGKRWIEADLLDRVLEDRSGGQEGSTPQTLTPRERTIVSLVAKGCRNQEISEQLGISTGTVKGYLHELYQRLNIDNRTELAVWAQENGLR
jgi:two-component system, NarL family, nitrate/nitrite response regulator NarL